MEIGRKMKNRLVRFLLKYTAPTCTTIYFLFEYLDTRVNKDTLSRLLSDYQTYRPHVD